MAQLTISFGIDFESRSNNNQSFVKVAHRSSITANEESDFGDIYEEYEDFQYTSQVVHEPSLALINEHL